MASGGDSEFYRQVALFGEVLERVRADYVEKPNDQQLIEDAINGMLTALDPHSSYLNPKNFRDMQVQTRGEFGGLVLRLRWRRVSSRWSLPSRIPRQPKPE